MDLTNDRTIENPAFSKDPDSSPDTTDWTWVDAFAADAPTPIPNAEPEPPVSVEHSVDDCSKDHANQGPDMPVEKLENDAEEVSAIQPSKAKTRVMRRSRSSKSAAEVKMGSDPLRFLPPGVDFRAKLIGKRTVEGARGDVMCQQAMQACKASVKASGQHKQKIIVSVSTDGLTLKDQLSGNEIEKFSVSKISFIARDPTDSRAFGFVYGTPESEHKFYGIKTEKTADQLVISIRDMFHVVYEMKKKRIEEEKAKQHGDDANENATTNGTGGGTAAGEIAVADLLDLESEAADIQQGMEQIERAWESFADGDQSSEPSPVKSDTTSLNAATQPQTNGLHNLQELYNNSAVNKTQDSAFASMNQSSQLSGLFSPSYDPAVSMNSSAQSSILTPPPTSVAHQPSQQLFDSADIFGGPPPPASQVGGVPAPSNSNPFSAQPLLQPIGQSTPAYGGGGVGPQPVFNFTEPRDIGGKANFESTFNKLVGNIETLNLTPTTTAPPAVVPPPLYSTQSILAPGGLPSMSPPKADPFADIRNPPKRSINDLLKSSPKSNGADQALSQLSVLMSTNPPTMLDSLTAAAASEPSTVVRPGANPFGPQPTFTQAPPASAAPAFGLFPPEPARNGLHSSNSTPLLHMGKHPNLLGNGVGSLGTSPSFTNGYEGTGSPVGGFFGGGPPPLPPRTQALAPTTSLPMNSSGMQQQQPRTTGTMALPRPVPSSGNAGGFAKIPGPPPAVPQTSFSQLATVGGGDGDPFNDDFFKN